jgi:hypothetical protein
MFHDLFFMDLPSYVEKGLDKVFERQKNNDFDGAITAICGIFDTLTEKFYQKLALGDHKNTDYQQRINKSFQTFKDSYILHLKKSGLDEQNAAIWWNNYCKSINSAAFILASMRREFSDVHGIECIEQELVQVAMNCATYILRSFLILHPYIPQDHPIFHLSDSTRNFLTNCIAIPIGRNTILNSPQKTIEKFLEIHFTKSDTNDLIRIGIINEKRVLTEKGIEILRVIARNL